MESFISLYSSFENRILKHLKENEIIHRSNSSTGLWLGPLVGLSAAATILREDNSYSEICLLVGISGIGLIIGSMCLYARLIAKNVAVKDFHLLYFLPAIVTSTLYLIVANKGLLLSVAWGLSVGTLSTWGVMQTMSHFPGCFTIGEATIVTHGVVLFLLSVFTNLPLRYHLPPIHNNDIVTVILQVGILFIGCFCILIVKVPILQKTKYFYTTFFAMLLFVTIPVWHILLDQSPFLWIISYVCSNILKILLMFYWIIIFTIGVGLLVYKTYYSHAQTNTATRKTYHILGVLAYTPGLILEPVLLYLASGVVIAVFILLDLIRILNIPPLGHTLQHGFKILVDTKDTLLSMTALYLVCGFSLPLWMPTENLELLLLFSGILTVGIGDSCASYFGIHYGKHKWPGLKKTYEGTLACILSQVGMILLLALFGLVNKWLVFKGICAVIAVSLVEARTDQIDNLALPFSNVSVPFGLM